MFRATLYFWAAFCLTLLVFPSAAQAEKFELKSVTEVEPPPHLYHWTAISKLNRWSQGNRTGPLPLMSEVSESSFGAALKRSFNGNEKALFAWEHPVGGMADQKQLYPTTLTLEEAAGGMLQALGLPNDAAGRAALAAISGTVSGVSVDPKDRALITLAIKQGTKALKIEISGNTGFSTEQYIREILPQLKEGRPALVQFVRRGENGQITLQEWVVLNNSAIESFDADVTRTAELLRPHLAELERGEPLPPHVVHVASSFLNQPKGRTEAIRVLKELTTRDYREGNRIPPFFQQRSFVFAPLRSPPLRLSPYHFAGGKISGASAGDFQFSHYAMNNYFAVLRNGTFESSHHLYKVERTSEGVRLTPKAIDANGWSLGQPVSVKFRLPSGDLDMAEALLLPGQRLTFHSGPTGEKGASSDPIGLETERIANIMPVLIDMSRACSVTFGKVLPPGAM